MQNTSDDALQLTPLFNLPILVRGSGDLGSGVVYRLVKAGFPVVISELEKPLLVRPTVSYGAAVFRGQIEVEGIAAKRMTIDEALTQLSNGKTSSIPVVIDPDGKLLSRLKPPVVVDGRMAKFNLGTTIHDAPLVIGMGPGFTAGVDCHAVIETNRGHALGRVIWKGSAEPDTGTPGAIGGKESERVLRSPRAGYVTRQIPVGTLVGEGEPVAWMDDEPLRAPFNGVLRGLIDESVYVPAGLKVGDVDPRARSEHCFAISDKALAIGGGVVEAVFSAPQVRPLLANSVRGTA